SAQKQIGKRIAGVVRVAEIAAKEVRALRVVDRVDAYVACSVLPIKPTLELVASFDPGNVVREISIVIGTIEGPSVVESERRCSTGYSISRTLCLGSSEVDRGNKVLKVPAEYLIQTDHLAVRVLEVRKSADGCKRPRVIGPILLMYVVRTGSELGDQVRPE